MSAEVEQDEFRTLRLPLNLWDRLLLVLMRKMKENGEDSNCLFGEEDKVRRAARIRGMELLLIDIEEEYLRQ